MSSQTVPSKDLRHGHKVVTTDAERLTDLDLSAYAGVVLRCPGSRDPNPNTKPVWIGGPGVTADHDTGTGGMPIVPGDSFTIPGDRAKEIWVITSDGADQDIAFMVL